jgi:hypothetical protein
VTETASTLRYARTDERAASVTEVQPQLVCIFAAEQTEIDSLQSHFDSLKS